MSKNPTPPPDPAAAPPKKRGLFHFLFKTGLGCSAFALGVLVVLVLLLPTLLSGFAAEKAGDVFGERYRGTLKVERTELAWFSEQKVDGVVLRDPEGHEVVRASAVLPSLLALLRSGATRIGKVRLAIDADLVQDEAGVTNLQRALEEKGPGAKSETAEPRSEGGALDRLAELELDLVITSKHLSWSDRETRRIGTPFEVRDLEATLLARPRAPLAVHAKGRIVSESPGQLAIDATLAGPIEPQKPWPFGKVDAEVRIEGFSTAMVDGIANLGGNLVEVLGRRFTLKAVARGATLEGGDVDLALDGERAGIALAGSVEGGLLRSSGTSGLVASFPAPRGFLEQYVTARLPTGTKLVLDAGSEPWTVRAPEFAIPLPRGGATDLPSLVPILEQSRIDLSVDVPSRFAFENELTRARGVPLAARGIRARLRTEPGAPLVGRVEATLESGESGELVADVTAKDCWKKLAAGALPIVDLDAHVRDVSTAALGALFGEKERLVSAAGARLGLEIEAREASLDSGTLRARVVGRDGDATRLALDAAARVAGGQVQVDGANEIALRLSPSAEWLSREIAAFAGEGTDLQVASGTDAITLELSEVVLPLPAPAGGDWMGILRKNAAGRIVVTAAGASFADATLKAAGTRITTSGIELTGRLAQGGAATLAVRSDFAQGSAAGKLVVDASTNDAFVFAAVPHSLPPIDARVVVSNLPAPLVDLFVQHRNIVERALSSPLSIAFDAKGASLSGGTIVAEVEAPNARLKLGGRVEGATFRASGEDALHVEARIPAAVLQDELASALPSDARLSFPGGVAVMTLDAREIAVPLPKTGEPFALGALLDGLAARLNLGLAGVGFENAATRERKIEPAARDLVVEAVVAPRAPLELSARASFVPGRDARLALQARLADPFALAQGSPLQPVDGKLELQGLDTGTLDALAGADGLLAGLLGDDLKLAVEARNASPKSGSLVIEAVAPRATLRAAARFDEAGLTCAGNDVIELRATPEPGFVKTWTSRVLPEGTRLELAEGAGPLALVVRNVAIPMPKPAAAGAEPRPLLESLAGVAFDLAADLPSLVYHDAATDAARKPVTVSGVKLTSGFKPGAQPFASLAGTIVDEPPGAIAADVRALDPLTKLSEPAGLDTFRARVDLTANRVPTAIVDVLARQGGLLVEALGGRLDLAVSAPDISMEKGAFTLDMHSDLHGVKGEGHVEKGAIVVDRVDGLVATVGLGPVMSQRVVGKLVPTMVAVQKPAGAAPARFSVDALRFPLDGDLRKLDGTVRVDLGEVSYALFPKLAAIFQEPGSPGAVKIPVLTVPIQQGVAGYQRLPLKIGAKEYFFSGTYDIVTDVAQLSTNVPVSVLGKSVNKKLDELREWIDPSITVPLTIRGSILNPSVGVDDKALLKVIEDAGKKALENAAGGLLDDLLKKKKKKD